MKLRKILTVSAATLMALSVGANINNVNAKRRPTKHTARQVHNNKSSKKYYEANMKTIRNNNKSINRLKRHHQHNKNWKKIIQLYKKENNEIRRRIYSKRNIKSLIDEINVNMADINSTSKEDHKNRNKRNASAKNLYPLGYREGKRAAKDMATPYDFSDLIKNRNIFNKTYDNGLMNGYSRYYTKPSSTGSPKSFNTSDLLAYRYAIMNAQNYLRSENKNYKSALKLDYLSGDIFPKNKVGNLAFKIYKNDPGYLHSHYINSDLEDAKSKSEKNQIKHERNVCVNKAKALTRQFNKHKRYYMFG